MRFSKVCALGGVLAAVMVLGAQPASAGEFRWQSDQKEKYLNVNGASLEDGGRVIVSDSNAGNPNQWWGDQYYSDGYFRITNMNSGKRLGRRDATDATVNNWGGAYPAACDVIQWSANTGNGQAWKYRSYITEGNKTVILWINKLGCNGNAYWDVLSTVDQNTRIYLTQEDDCNYGDWSGEHSWCHWKRNGQFGS